MQDSSRTIIFIPSVDAVKLKDKGMLTTLVMLAISLPGQLMELTSVTRSWMIIAILCQS